MARCSLFSENLDFYDEEYAPDIFDSLVVSFQIG